MRRIIAAAAVAAAAIGLAIPAASAGAPARSAAVYIRIAGTDRCVTAPRAHPGAPVIAQHCRQQADQRWIVHEGVVRLPGTRLRMIISRRNYCTVLALPGSWTDDWRLNLRHTKLRDLVLSHRYNENLVLTLSSLYRVDRCQPHQLVVGQVIAPEPYWQGVRLIPVYSGAART